MGCDIHTHAPAKKGSTNFMPYPLDPRKCSTKPVGHGHGREFTKGGLVKKGLAIII